MKSFCFVVSIILIWSLRSIKCSIPGPAVKASKGEVWPKPQQQNVSDKYFVFRPRNFEFEIAKGSSNCGFIQNALNRYFKILQENQVILDKQTKHRGIYKYKKSWVQDDDYQGYIDCLTVNLTGGCDNNLYPDIDMDEKYKLWVTPDRTELQATSIWGILRGLETFSQLVYLGDDGLTLRINATVIKDYPRYKHRGLLIDTSRHFIPMDKIYLTLDALAYNKMNVLHWHIVDDQSFPYFSEKFPELSEQGAYNKYTKVYMPEDIENVIEYARIRGIRVLPEFDTPGHTSSWGLSHPEILTPCEVYNTYGPMDPSKNATFELLQEFFGEVRQVFKDDFVHLGGDEVDFICWQADNNISNFMKKQNLTTYKDLESFYIQKVVNMVENLQFKSIVWEEVFSNGVKLPNETLVHVWKGGWTSTMKSVTEAGKFGLLSACWYLDDIGAEWNQYYMCDPTDFDGTQEQQELVLGGEACMWGEMVNEYNIISRVWPRASATAEKLWSAKADGYDLDEPSRRIEEHACRLNRRGIVAQPPNGPGYCD
ncbi:unnamed protein product [Ceutorhynchus assimilis]|uniref:Beta-hexosaminidase n=1 Tax=Ceutorhynchus assimilis TaxID=467358 RepID=A0A9N9QGT2_9CUCU|nr:unnamed protein product [Ceutorhynchus assimilis]